MDWIPIKHKDLYYKAAGALYEDAKTLSASLLDTTGKVISNGYEIVKENVNYIDKKWHESDESESKNPLLSDSDNYESEDYESDTYLIDETDESLVSMGRVYPDILIELYPEKKYLSKIYVMDNEGNKNRITGKISSYDYIDKIINQWFVYDNDKTKKYHWYPKEELYTAFREYSGGKLYPMDNVIFQYYNGRYEPHYYHPLM